MLKNLKKLPITPLTRAGTGKTYTGLGAIARLSEFLEDKLKPELIEDTNLDQVTLVMKMEKESDDNSAEKSADSKK